MKPDNYKSQGVTRIERLVQTNLGWNKARSSFLINFIIALIKVRTVCLTEIATAFPGKAQITSKYKKLQRFFRFFDICFDSFAIFLSCFIPIERGMPWLLTIDRTN